MIHTRARAVRNRVLTWGPLVTLGVIAIIFKLTCPLAEQNGLGPRIITGTVFFTVGTGMIIHVRRALLRELFEVRKAAAAAQSMSIPAVPKESTLTQKPLDREWYADVTEVSSSTYESQLHAAQGEIDQDEIGDTIDEVAEFLGSPQLHEDVEQISSAAIAAEGLTEVFASLGPPPPGLIGKYGGGGSGSGDGVGAGPRGRNA